ncbi:hypothetical protein MAC_01070 [Metarhizium acridum CQMa 102]|uniref:Uncharacterized protein n=1 Tax=Metarhizium acridum (strain CQMa 102) TaxID=655827 RepID=E9DTX2_METAQ|nr:uncharacterized protein MAC_01070 [Metarhizium acridum CQMa 102]EFY92832.1 hypothetical protein MAC_01070 [Metarhizium acridum CQMa 102]
MDRKPRVPVMAFMQTDMESSLESTRDCTPVSINKNIPLLCTVCPEAPRFSDVSHLLTHIASKGHLHHETQTKLKSHQDIAASMTLQQYESWYKANGIEALLVERMKAKQKKEAAKTSRTRDSTPSVTLKSRRKSKRGSNKTKVKAEQDDLVQDYPLFPGFFPSEIDAEVDEEFANGDMLSLKGQVWPGMGKMDLANDDMKRTRNQRKPNSVIEKMKHTSEGIEPTQVIMTPDLEVERVKGVYDSSSPIPGQEEEFKTPKKIARPKRKRSQALAEISVNVPRRASRRPGRRNGQSKVKASPEESNGDSMLPIAASTTSLRHGNDVFRDNDDDGVSGLYGDRMFTTPSRQDQRPDLRNRIGLYPYDLSVGQPEATSFTMNDPSIYNYSSRLPFLSCNNVGSSGNYMFRFNSNSLLQPKPERHQSPGHGEMVNGTGNPQYLHISESNPLFAQDRPIFGSYSTIGPSQTLSSFNIQPISRSSDYNQAAANNQEDHATTSCSIKMESHYSDMMANASTGECKQRSFTENEVWASTETLDL